ncbi:MAG: YbjN domain-containing protein [Hyphomonadaceae bacterium]|nr:YbjN domain-containing protein [Hyphomonadaceae bacterium]MBX3511559.1 YbjN domain-containing protein [Hyphomonadaceae bacterium]
MDLTLDDDFEPAGDPLDTVETVLAADDRFASERAEDGDVHFVFKSNWNETAGYFSYRQELPALLFTLGFDIQAPASRRGEAIKLAAAINENLWLGHFDVWSDDGTIIFRHAMPMIGRDEISIGEVQAMLAAAMDAAERFQPAFHFAILGGMAAEDAAKAAFFETSGEA